MQAVVRQRTARKMTEERKAAHLAFKEQTLIKAKNVFSYEALAVDTIARAYRAYRAVSAAKEATLARLLGGTTGPWLELRAAERQRAGWVALRELLWEVASHQIESVHASLGLAPRRAPDGGSAEADGGASVASSTLHGSPTAHRNGSPTAHRNGSPTAHRSSLGDSRNATPNGQRSGAWKGTVIRSATAAAGARSGATVFVDGRAVPQPGAAGAALGRQISAARKLRQKRELELSSLGARLQLCDALRTTLAERTEGRGAPISAPISAPSAPPHDEVFRELRELRAEIEARMLSHELRSPGHELRSPGLSAATSAISASMLVASKLDASYAAAHTLIAHAAELRGMGECATTLAARFPGVEGLWGIIPSLRARLRAVEAEAAGTLAEAAAISTAEESTQMERARHKLLTELLELDVPGTACGAALRTALDERAVQTRARLAELQADGAVPSVDEADAVSDALERAGQSLGALRLLTELRRRDLELEISSLRMQRLAALRSALVCRERARLRALTEHADFLRRCVAYAEGLPSRVLVRRVEAEASLMLAASGRRQSDAVTRGFDDSVGHACVVDLLNWWHADAHLVTLRIAEVKQPTRDRYLLTVQVLPTALLSRATSPVLRATSPVLRATSPVRSPMHSPGATKLGGFGGFGGGASCTDDNMEPPAEAAVEAVNELMRLMTGEVGKTNSFEPEVMTLMASDNLDCQ